MSGRSTSLRHALLVRCYPRRWRARYGTELSALIEDTARAGELGVGARVGLLRGAVREHARELGLGPDRRSPADEVRDGSLLVLIAWMVFSFGGLAFAKFAEHWQAFTPRRDWVFPAVGYDVAAVAAVGGALVIAVGALIALLSAVRYARAGGWRDLRPAVLSALSLSALTGAVFAFARASATGVGLLGVSQSSRVGSEQPNGPGIAVGVLVTALTLLALVSVGSWTAVGLRVVRGARLSSAVVVTEGALAAGLTGLMGVVLGGMTLWWGAMLVDVPSFLDSGLVGATGAELVLQVLVAGLVMGGSLVMAIRGSRRVLSVLHPPAG